MKGIIEQISHIDDMAFKNEQKNKYILNNERQKYENEIKNFRYQKLKTAEDNAKNIYNQIISKAKTECQQEEKKVKKVKDQIENNYVKVEKIVMNQVLDKLFQE